MAHYTWEETRKNIYDSLPREEKIVPCPKYCLLHDKELKETYVDLETTLRGKVLPWLIDKELNKVLAENVCCCPPSKRSKKAHYSNLPQDVCELKHWKTYENTMNQFNNTNSAFPQQAKPAIHKILELHLKQNVPHYEIFLNMLLDYVEKPYRDYFELKVESEKDIEKAFGPGDFFLQIFQNKYNTRVLYCYENQMLGVMVAARSFTDFKRIKSYIVEKIEDDGYLDALNGNLSTSGTYASDITLNPTRKKHLLKHQFVNALQDQKQDYKQEIINTSSYKHSDGHQIGTDVTKKRLKKKHLNLKRCGRLKADKQDVSYISNLNVNKPVRENETTVMCTSTEELGMLHILMGDELDSNDRENQTLNTGEMGEENSSSEEMKMLQIMMCNEDIERNHETQVSQLFEKFKFRKQKKEKHRVELNINLVSSRDTESQTVGKLIRTEVNFELIKCEKPKVSKLKEYKKYYSNHFWLLLFLYFTLLGLCIFSV